MSIQRGDLLEATSARGERVRLRALGGPQPGRDFTVVWVCRADAYTAELAPEAGVPWPADELHVLAHT